MPCAHFQHARIAVKCEHVRYIQNGISNIVTPRCMTYLDNSLYDIQQLRDVQAHGITRYLFHVVFYAATLRDAEKNNYPILS